MPRSGYRWWYLDALSDDGRNALTIIAFVGSVFSPYYAARRRLGMAQAVDHCAVNVALYLPGAKRWAMTERGRSKVVQASDRLGIGPSQLLLDGEVLTFDLRERCAPWPAPVCGTVTVRLPHILEEQFALDASAAHHWRPIAPRARVEVNFVQPQLRWTGEGYLDSNWGTRHLEKDFVHWSWSRSSLRDGRTAIFYDVQRKDGSLGEIALLYDKYGRFSRIEAPPRASLSRSAWGVDGEMRTDHGQSASLVRRLEDGPFYARSLVRSRLWNDDVVSVHESVSLKRFSSRWVQTLLPFRMPRNPF